MSNVKKILLIEDDVYLARGLKYLIENEGHNLTICSDTDEILQIYPEIDTYDTIILGIMMLKEESFLESEEEEEKKLDVGEILYIRIRKDFPKKDILILTSKQNIMVNIKNTTVIRKPITEKKYKDILKYIR